MKLTTIFLAGLMAMNAFGFATVKKMNNPLTTIVCEYNEDKVQREDVYEIFRSNHLFTKFERLLISRCLKAGGKPEFTDNEDE